MTIQTMEPEQSTNYPILAYLPCIPPGIDLPALTLATLFPRFPLRSAIHLPDTGIAASKGNPASSLAPLWI
jgi:hypothetical protein